jgi:hypothetical protein
MYNDKTKWDNLSAGSAIESAKISKLLGANVANILRIGNDTSDENEMIHMDGIFLQAKVINLDVMNNSEILICTYQGRPLLREMKDDDVVAYYIVDDENAPRIEHKLTLDKLKEMRPGVFAQGEIENSPEGLYMTSSNIGKKLLWVAKRGVVHDWAIYAHWAEKGFDFVTTQGDKVSKGNARKLVPCTDEALSMYRQ